jgi:hypothetical protein
MARRTKRDLSPGPGQMQMLMSAKEIMNQYQVLDGDRQAKYDERQYQPTWRSATTGGGTNDPIRTQDRPWLERQAQQAGTNLASQTHFRGGEHEESDAAVWARKLDEAHMSPGDYHAARYGSDYPGPEPPGYETLAGRSSAPQNPLHNPNMGMSTFRRSSSSIEESHDMKMQSYVDRKYMEHDHYQNYGPSLVQHIRESGGVESPVRLGTELGSQGKPQVIGGHHRIAAMSDIDPDQPMPVVHDVNIWHARQSSAYPYT